MQFNNNLKRKTSLVGLLGLLFGLASCGSYQYVGVDTDGIYGGTPIPQNTETVVEVPNESNDSNYYQDYFKTKSIESENINFGDEIFTDIDAYEGPDYDETDPLANDYQGQPGWGQNPNNVTINYIDNGWNNWGWNGGFGWGFNNWGWNNWGWNRGFGGWNNWGWNGGFGGWNNWGWNGGFRGGFFGGWHNPFWGSPFIGGGFNHWGFNNGWGFNRGFVNNRFNNFRGRQLAYNNSRRGSYTGNSRGRSAINNRGSVNRQSRSNTSKYNTSRRGTVNRNSNGTTVNRSAYSSNGTRTSSGVTRRSSVTRTPSTNSASRASSSTSRRSSSNVYRQSTRRSSGTEVLQDQVQHQDLQAAAEVMEVALDLHEVAEDAANT